MISEDSFREILKLKGGHLFRREGQELEFKEQFSLAGLAEYFKDFSAFANNRGGLLVFGIKDSPRIPIGLTSSSKDQFAKVDPERITGFLLDAFSGEIPWEQALFEVEGKDFGVFQIFEAMTKPIIAKRDEGRDQQIRNGEIYYRYAGRTQKIQYAELQTIIEHRVDQNNKQWLDLMAKIGKAGPQNAAILDTEKALIEKDDARVLVVDHDLARKIKFIKEGDFSEKKGAPALKLVGDVVPIDRVEVVQRIRENLTSQYPLSAMELYKEVKKQLPAAPQNHIWRVLSENGLKNNPDYAAFNFRSKQQESECKATGKIPSSIPCIYKPGAVDFIVKVLRNEGFK